MPPLKVSTSPLFHTFWRVMVPCSIPSMNMVTAVAAHACAQARGRRRLVDNHARASTPSPPPRPPARTMAKMPFLLL
jgi:hypothetical protein